MDSISEDKWRSAVGCSDPRQRWPLISGSPRRRRWVANEFAPTLSLSSWVFLALGGLAFVILPVFGLRPLRILRETQTDFLAKESKGAKFRPVPGQQVVRAGSGDRPDRHSLEWPSGTTAATGQPARAFL